MMRKPRRGPIVKTSGEGRAVFLKAPEPKPPISPAVPDATNSAIYNFYPKIALRDSGKGLGQRTVELPRLKP